MKWQDATLMVPVEYDTDALGNKVVVKYEECPAKARMTNWTNEEKTALDPEYTRLNRKLILRQSRDESLSAESVVIDGNSHLITDRIVTDRWQILHIRGYKQ